MIIATSYLSKSQAAPFEKDTLKADINKALDSIDNALKERDANKYLSFLAEDALFMGTDSKEFWDKASYSKIITEMLAKPTKTPIKIDKREIRLSKDGNSAIVISQFVPGWTKNIPTREVMHLTKVGEKWKIDFSSLALIPNNEDLDKIFNAMEK